MASDSSLDLDSRIMVAMQEARRHHLGWWLAELERHRGCRSFRPFTDAYRLEYGFSCGCSGAQQDFAIRVHCLREALPEARASVMRMFSRAVGKGETRAILRARAERKARAILYRFLTKEQKWHLRAVGYFTVTGSDGRTYEIYRGLFNNVKVSWRGRELRFCVQPVKGGCLPVSDTMLYQKILLETDVRLFLDAAFVQDAAAGLIYESGSFVHDGSDPVVKSTGRVLRVTVPDAVLDSPVEFMHEQMTQGLTAVEVVSSQDAGLRSEEGASERVVSGVVSGVVSS